MEDIKSNEKKVRKIGRLTFGITLIIIGITILLQFLFKINVIKYVIMSWPVILIILGIEVIYYSKKDNINIKYDVAGIILTFFVLFIASIFSLITYGIQTLSNYSEKEIVNELINNNYTMKFDKGVEITNLTDTKINVKQQINSGFDYTHVIAKINYNDEFRSNLINIVNNNYSLYNMITIDENKDENEFSKITIVNVPDYVESIEIIITTNNKDLIKLSGNINSNI